MNLQEKLFQNSSKNAVTKKNDREIHDKTLLAKSNDRKKIAPKQIVKISVCEN